MGREREAFCGLKNRLNEALPQTMTWKITALSFLGILLDSNQLSHVWQPIGKVQIGRGMRNKVKRIRRERKHVRLHSGAGPLHIPLKLSFVVQ